MPIHVACPGCGRKFQAPDNLSGKRVKCPGCAAAFVVNAPVPEAPDPRLTPCPDCGKAISKRADQCPHCGCPMGRPAASAAGQPALPGNDPATEAVPKRRRPVLAGWRSPAHYWRSWRSRSRRPTLSGNSLGPHRRPSPRLPHRLCPLPSRQRLPPSSERPGETMRLSPRRGRSTTFSGRSILST